jgi:Molybdopterin oxidoreductase Fe4S4 domain
MIRCNSIYGAALLKRSSPSNSNHLQSASGGVNVGRDFAKANCGPKDYPASGARTTKNWPLSMRPASAAFAEEPVAVMLQVHACQGHKSVANLGCSGSPGECRSESRPGSVLRRFRGDTMAILCTVFRTCTLCEAMCGLKLELDGDRVVAVRGDEADPFSRGYICPKGVAIADVHYNPDRLRTPLRE